MQATPRHTNPLLPLLPSGPDGVHSLSLRGDPHEPPLRTAGLPAAGNDTTKPWRPRYSSTVTGMPTARSPLPSAITF